MSEKNAKPPKPDAKQRSSMLFWLGCASASLIILLVAVGITMMIMLRRNLAPTAATGRDPALLANWRANLRADRAAPPEAALLAPPRTDSGNAAAQLGSLPNARRYQVAYMRMMRHQSADSADPGVSAALLRDTMLDRVAAAARMKDYLAATRMLADTAQSAVLFGVRIPLFFGSFSRVRAVEMLIARGYARAAAGRQDQARGDYRAAIGLGLMMIARDPSLIASAQGARLVGDAASRLGEITPRRDTATARAAERLVQWSTRVGNDARGMTFAFGVPDSLLAGATDTTLPFPLRAEAVSGGAFGSLMRGPWSVYRGPTRATFRIVRAVEQDPDRELAAIALAIDTALARVDRVGGWTRLRWYMRAQRIN